MSMISSLIDELRKSADEWNGSNMFELARMCSEAADTIWQLRDDLQRANAAVRDAEHDESMAWDRVRKAEADNAKLQELVRKMMHFFEDGDWCTICECVQECDAQEQYEEDCLMRGVFHNRMRELGVKL